MATTTIDVAVINNEDNDGRKGILYLEEPCTAKELSIKCSNWMGVEIRYHDGPTYKIDFYDNIDLVRSDISHFSLNKAPTIAKDIAERMSQALGDAILPAGETDVQGIVIVIVPKSGITSTSENDNDMIMKSIIFDALGFKHVIENDENAGKVVNLMTLTTIEQKNYSDIGIPGFCYNQDESSEDDIENDDFCLIQETTMLMGEELTNHFEFSFNDSVI